ncbi:hypothetical protein HID58_011296 [Brassica napus]|uniref:Uncharacterized protein n=1 Tax=Brassica napus TaxID=3708 RepID=A0ABQ8DXY7_BRANA|nr:hypothetical protein HID58_011296 [Brassica napus]
MRVLLCKIQCPSFICFSKPSPHIYTPGSQRLESTPPQVASSASTVVDDNDDDHYVDAHVEEGVDHVNGLLNKVRETDYVIEEKEEDCTLEEKQEEEEGHSDGEILRSSTKEVLDSADGGIMEKKKKVQWVDLMGKELAEVREFESSEEDDIRYDGDKSCVCLSSVLPGDKAMVKGEEACLSCGFSFRIHIHKDLKFLFI